VIRDIIEAADMDIYPQIGLALFLFSFAAILARVFFMSKGAAHDAARMPLVDEPGAAREVSHE
jgi:hypothetical protein